MSHATDDNRTKRTYRGWLREGDYGDNGEALFLTGQQDAAIAKYQYAMEPLARTLQDDLESYGHYVTVRYFTSDRERSIDELTADLIRATTGEADFEYSDRYSEITGYLWTDEALMVGGHDLLAELRSSVGRFAHLEIEYSTEPAKDSRCAGVGRVHEGCVELSYAELAAKVRSEGRR